MKSWVMIGVLFGSGLRVLAAGPHSIENATLAAQYDDAAGTFSVTERSTGQMFLGHGKQEGNDGKATVTSATDAVFGKGQRIVVTQADGSTTSMELYNGLPFVLIRSTRHNGGKDVLDLNKTVPATFTLDLGKPASELRTMGTGGLLAPDKNPGSYLFLACADPATRRGVVAGWVTEDRGSGVLFSSVKDGKVEFKAQIDYGHLRIPAGKSVQLETLAVGFFGDARIGLELYAEALKKQYNIKLRAPEATYCTWYSEKHGRAGDEISTVELAKFAAKELKPFGLGVVQIDDSWQVGNRRFDRVSPDGPYAHGIAPVAAEVDKAGLTLGLWWVPFGRNFKDPEYKDRQDWFVKRENGEPYDTPWGGTCLDLTHPEVKEHLAGLVKLYRSWGVKYFKMDGLWTGAACEQNDSVSPNDGYRDANFGNNQPFHDPWVSNIEGFRSGLKLLRQNAGDVVFFSGCCITQNKREMTALGLVDSMRIGPDVSGGHLRGSWLYFLNGRVWWNDPDRAAELRADRIGSARFGTSWVALTGQFFLLSNWLPDLPAEGIEILKRTMAHHDAIARPVDYFDREFPNTWIATDTRQAVRRDVIGVFNFGDSELNVAHTCERLGLDPGKTYHVFDFWANAPLPDFTGSFKTKVAPWNCGIIAVRANEGHPVLLSTSCHVTQGIVDITDEAWRKGKLSATSKVVGSDPYELRIAGLTDGGKTWKPVSADVSAGDKAAGVTVSSIESNGLARVTLQCPQSRDVKWTVQFEGTTP